MTVNLNVSCDRNGAHLDWNSGGLAVRSIRLAKHCTYQNESTYQVSQCVHVEISDE